MAAATESTPSSDRAPLAKADAVQVYSCEDVRAVTSLNHSLLSNYPGTRTVGQVLEEYATVLHRAASTDDASARVQVANWCPPDEQKKPFALALARRTIEREHGFEEPPTEAQRAAPMDSDFEAAVSLALTGDIAGLTALLDTHPHLTAARSPFGHSATLLHYLASNGVETWRQVVPLNVADVARLLIAYGADVGATMTVYGGEFTAGGLLESSAHPRVAGVLDALRPVLCPE